MAVVVSMTGRRRLAPWRPVVIVAAALLLLLSVLSTTAAARPLDGDVDGWAIAAAAGGGTLPGGGASIMETLRRLYLQQLAGSGPSCSTNSPNNGCPP
ncbi:hypothetical protein ABZP36_010143 [Zizania latifolia]